MEQNSSSKPGTVDFKKSKFICLGCNRTLDDCVFVDEDTKLFTPYCKTCRSVMKAECILSTGILCSECLQSFERYYSYLIVQFSRAIQNWFSYSPNCCRQ